MTAPDAARAVDLGPVAVPGLGAAMRAATALADAANVRGWTAEDVARALDVVLVVCSVPECTLRGSRPGGHHHHDAISRKPSPLACRCAHPSAR